MSENKMRILVISDSHGRNDDVAGVIEQVGPIDMLIHCGDVERGDDYIRSLVDCPVHMVSGTTTIILIFLHKTFLILAIIRYWLFTDILFTYIAV